MDSSPTAIALITVAAIAGLFGFVLSIVNQKRVRHTVTWLQDNRPAEWQALPWFLRTVHPLSAIARLNRQLSGDPEFAMHYAAVYRGRPPMLAALGVSLGSIIIALAGSFAGFWTF